MEITRSGSAIGASTDRSLRCIRDAIALVASGASPRVVVAGIGPGETLLGSATRLALEAGVRARPLWRHDGSGADISVERVHD